MCENCVLNILCFVGCASMFGERNAHQCLLLSDRSLILGTQSTRKKISYWTGNKKCISAIVVTFFLCKGKDDLLCSCHLLSILCIACQSPGYWTSPDLLPLFCKVFSTPLCKPIDFFFFFFLSANFTVFYFKRVI